MSNEDTLESFEFVATSEYSRGATFTVRAETEEKARAVLAKWLKNNDIREPVDLELNITSQGHGDLEWVGDSIDGEDIE